MAVQAHHLSNAFSADYYSRVQVCGGVLGGSGMMQNRDLQIGQCFQAMDPDVFSRDASQIPAGMINAVGRQCDYQQSSPTCNVLSSRGKRSRNELNTYTAWPIYQQLCLLNASTAASFRTCTVTSPSSLNVCSELIESATSLPVPLSPYESIACPDILALLCNQSNEVDSLLRNQSEKLRLGMSNAQKRHNKQLISALTQRAMKRLKEKETELENICRKNVELEEKTKQINAESLIWFNIAKTNEAVVSSLRSRLEQAILHNVSSPVSAKEGYGDSHESPFPADDAQSCCFEAMPVHEQMNGDLRCLSVCKVCKENDVSVLVLPCRHLCLCLSCVAEIDTCPICCSFKKATLQIYFG